MPIICWGNLAKSASDAQKIEQAIQEYVGGHDENPNAHMGTDYALGAHRLQNVLDHPYTSIRWWHMLDLHAEAITAGALVIKGNGPYMVVQDGAGAERVKVYPEGIIVKNGFVSIQDYMARVVFDSRGIVSTNNFQAPGLSSGVLNQQFTVTADVTNSSITFVLARSAVVLFFYSGSVRVSKGSGESLDFGLSLFLDTLEKDTIDFQTLMEFDQVCQGSGQHYFDTLAAGSHTVKLRGMVWNRTGTSTALVYKFRLSYVILGS